MRRMMGDGAPVRLFEVDPIRASASLAGANGAGGFESGIAGSEAHCAGFGTATMYRRSA